MLVNGVRSGTPPKCFRCSTRRLVSFMLSASGGVDPGLICALQCGERHVYCTSVGMCCICICSVSSLDGSPSGSHPALCLENTRVMLLQKTHGHSELHPLRPIIAYGIFIFPSTGILTRQCLPFTMIPCSLMVLIC